MQLQKMKGSLPIPSKEIEVAVQAFLKDSRVTGNLEGVYTQTLKSIASSIFFDSSDKQQFWLATDGEKVMGYALTHVCVDVDDQLTFTIPQAWVHPEVRRKPIVKQWYKVLEAEAERCLCKHILFPSSRHPKAYLRFLGPEYHEYTTLIKKDL